MLLLFILRFSSLLNGRTFKNSRNSLRLDISEADFVHLEADPEYEFRQKNRQRGDSAVATALSAFYAKLIVVLGIAFPVTDVIGTKAPYAFYQGFYLYLYIVSVSFVAIMYVARMREKKTERGRKHGEKDNEKNRVAEKIHARARFGSFYLRVGAVAFGIGSMVYSGLEFGQFFELKGDSGCQNILVAVTPAARMILSIMQMQFVFLNTKEFEMRKHGIVVRFGLMHMVATNLCEWLYVLIEETKHEIINLAHKQQLTGDLIDATSSVHGIAKRASGTQIVVECRRTNIMGSLVQNASPFLFPCTIEYSLICAVILFEMWRQAINTNTSKPRNRKISSAEKNAHHFSVDCSRAHNGMFAGILIIVLSIISLIMFYVLSKVPAYRALATLEVTVSEVILYLVTSIAVIGAFVRMRDLKFSQSFVGIPLDCTLLLVAQSGVYFYCMFSIIGCFFSMNSEHDKGAAHGFIAEVFSLLQTSIQTLFILNAWWRRCRSTREKRQKPGREIITFLLVANMAMWFINALVKSRAMFRPTHLKFFGEWSWTIITHVSMPLAIFYRFHSTICLFEIWKTTYKVRFDRNHVNHH